MKGKSKGILIVCILLAIVVLALAIWLGGRKEEPSAPVEVPQEEEAVQEDSAPVETPQEEPSAEIEHVLTIMIEGMEEQIPADLAGGEGYTILIPREGWTMSAADCWRLEENENVRLMVSLYEGMSLAQVEDALKTEGYEVMEDSDIFQKKLPDGLLQCQLLQEAGEKVWGVSYSYPDDPEYAEGFGTRLLAMASSLQILEEGETFGDGLSQDAQEVKAVVEAFSGAYFKGDSKAVQTYLTDPYEWDIEVRESAEAVSKVKVKGLEMIPESKEGDTCHVSVEFLDSPQSDSFLCLSVELVKQGEGWKVSFYGLEG